jgi:ABC-type Fe3+-hydroxamate transport system substrate-binding protein
VSTVRVVSLVPSATETLLALGADVVACTRFCEQPDLRHVGGTKNPDLDAILALAPDVVVVDEEENRREDAEALAAAGVEVLATAVRDVTCAREALVRLAARCERPEPGGLVWPDADPPPSAVAFVPIWRRPWMTINADTYGASVLRAIGVDLVTASRTDRYPTVELDDVGRPDLVLVPSEPYVFSDAHVADLAAAFPAARVQRVDGRDLFWWGVRTPGALERLRTALADRPDPADPGVQDGGDDVTSATSSS